MSSFHSQYEDPEKHLIGNLLSDQDDSFSFQSSSSQSSTRDLPPLSNAVGPIVGEFAPSWPEPPPPYTPPSALFLPPPGLPGSTWGEEGEQRRSPNLVDDWSSFLAKQTPVYNPFNERAPPRAAPMTAPVRSEAPMPFSYRDVVNRGVSSIPSSRHGSTSSMVKEEEKNGGRGGGKGPEESVMKTDASWKSGGTTSESAENFQQITRKKGGGGQKGGSSAETAKTAASLAGGGGGGAKARARAVNVPEQLLDPPPIEDNSRFTVLEKLPARRQMTEEEEGMEGLMERTPTATTLTKQERQQRGGGPQSSAPIKKRVTRREERRVDGIVEHAAIVAGWIRLVLLYVYSYARSGLSYVVELVMDCTTSLYALMRLAADRAWMKARCKVHEMRGKAVEWWNAKKKGEDTFGLAANIRLPETADEALERLLNARGQDAYSVLGVRADESEELIKGYYKKQALLVHPDKNVMEGAAEAFQILSKAFEVVSTPEKRRKYDGERMATNPLHKELTELYRALKIKVEETRNRMDCDCGMTHMRVASQLPMLAARYCRKCDTRHAAKNLDIWAESRFFGFFWVYYTCVNGVVYDISSWANCSTNQLKHLRVDHHTVQYRMLTTQQNKEARQRADRYLRMLSDGLEKATSMHVSAGSSQASLQPIEREEDRPRKAKRAPKKK